MICGQTPLVVKEVSLNSPITQIISDELIADWKITFYRDTIVDIRCRPLIHSMCGKNKMSQNLKRRFSISLFTGLICLTTISLLACSVPVFRYALEKWNTDSYQMVIFHKGKLSSEIDKFASPDGINENANLKIVTVDLNENPSEKWLALWKLHESKTLPHAVVVNPSPQPEVVWTGKPTKKKIENLVDSPMRQYICKQLIEGETAVWVLLAGKDKKENDAAFKTLTKELLHMQKTLKLPEIEEEDIAQGLVTGDPAKLKISFPLMRLSKDNPAEAMFIEMLLSAEEGLRDKEYIDKPMAFPIFGRGRALYALIGAGISKETISEACHTLTGPCTCQVKDQNPGTDLLMAIDWEKGIEEMFSVDTSQPELTGITSMVGTNDKATTTPQAKPPVTATTTNQTHSDAISVPEILTPEASNSIMQYTFIFLGGALLLVFGVSFFMFSRSR